MLKLLVWRYVWILLSLWLVLLLWTGWRSWLSTEAGKSATFFIPPSSSALDTSSRFSRSFVPSSQSVPSVHSVAVTAINHRQLEVVWFGGTREGARDVAIYANRFDTETEQWMGQRVLLTREQLMQQSRHYIKKLGNPVIYRDLHNTMHLFVVGVSIGGWATSRIYHLTSIDGEHYQFQQVLPLSPLLNISHLLRTPPVTLSDGGFYLPVYQELAYTFGVLLRFDAQGQLIAMYKPNYAVHQLQPSMAVVDDTHCISVWRSKRNRQPMMVQDCAAGGVTWAEPQWANVNNDNSSVVLFRYRDEMLLLHNRERAGNTRHDLYLSRLDEHATFSLITRLDATEHNGEVSYPAVWVVDDTVHVFYTYDRRRIRHIQFNGTWLQQQ